MENTKFTIIIPTRERYDTLGLTLKTCLNQNYENYEILVSDNFSQDKTKEVVFSFKDSRIRYINTGQRLSMSENWEFALSQVKDGYVMYLGDDDGLLPEALKKIDKIIEETKTEAVVWKPAHYNWPSYIDEVLKNTLYIYWNSDLKKFAAKKMLNKAKNYMIEYHVLPCIYNSFVSYKAIERVKSQSTNFFNSMTPDVYSAIVLASVMDSYYYSYVPYSLSGSSGHSGGRSFFLSDKNSPQAAMKFLSENNIPIHPKIALAPSIPIMVAECFLQAQEHVQSAKGLNINLKTVLEVALKDAIHQPPLVYEKVLEAIQEIASRNHLEDYTSQLLNKHQYVPVQRLYPALGFNIRGQYLLLNCSDFDAYDIYRASLLCNHILALKNSNYLTVQGIAKSTMISAKRLLLGKLSQLLRRKLKEFTNK